MKKYLSFFKNKYIATITIFSIYTLFLDDLDLVTIVSQRTKLSELRAQHSQVSQDLNQTKRMLIQLKHTSEIERLAREKKLFKKDDEDIFIITDK